MKLSSLVGSLVACLTVTVAPALHAAPLSVETVTQNRGEIIAELMQSWQQRINLQNLPVEDAKNWALRNAAKFSRLTDAQLGMARRASTIQELELLFITAPIADGTSLGALASSRPGNLTIANGASVSKSGGDANSNPTGSPALYNDLVFTAVTPCRIMDTRFSTSPLDGTAGAPWAANTTHIVAIGPYADYTFQGGQATSCAGPLVSANGDIAAAMTAISTVNQTGAGYMVFFPAGATNPNPNGVAQWFQPGFVQTSFVVMPTDRVSNVWSQGYIGNAGSHVIVDLIGYFSKAKAPIWAVMNADGTLLRGSRTSGAPVKLGTGIYQVTFDRDVSACKFDATIGTGTAGAAPPGNIAVSPRGGVPSGVWIQTYSSAGAGLDLPFHLAVTC